MSINELIAAGEAAVDSMANDSTAGGGLSVNANGLNYRNAEGDSTSMNASGSSVTTASQESATVGSDGRVTVADGGGNSASVDPNGNVSASSGPVNVSHDATKGETSVGVEGSGIGGSVTVDNSGEWQNSGVKGGRFEAQYNKDGSHSGKMSFGGPATASWTSSTDANGKTTYDFGVGAKDPTGNFEFSTGSKYTSGSTPGSLAVTNHTTIKAFGKTLYADSTPMEADTNDVADLFGGWLGDAIDAIRGYFGMFDILDDDAIDPSAADGFSGAQRFRGDPLTFDLDGDGIETVAPDSENPILFDHSGDGLRSSTGWIAPDDGLLVFDRNNNGMIDNGSELFGDNTNLYDDQGNVTGKAEDGFDALAQEDTNQDGIVDVNDDNFSNLRVWQDLNQDGVTDVGELKSLSTLGIAHIGVQSIENSQVLGDGNEIADIGTFAYTDGTTGNTAAVGQTADVNFLIDTFQREFSDAITITNTVTVLPGMQGSGLVRDLQEAASLQTVEGAALLNTLSSVVQATSTADLRTQIDQLLVDWAASSGHKDMALRAADHGYSLTSNLSAEWQQKLTVLEAFNGRGFFKMPWETLNIQGARVGMSVAGDQISVALRSAQLQPLDEAYTALKNSVYNAMARQTVLKPYVDDIGIKYASASDFQLDFDAFNARLTNDLAQNFDEGLRNVATFYRMGNGIMQEMGWDGISLFSEQLQQAEMSDDLAVVLAEIGYAGGVRQVTVDTPSLSGSAQGDIIYGDEADNYLKAAGGNDLIIAKGGNDTLDGGAGRDELRGGSGNDMYYVTSGDRITEWAGEGTDTVYSSDSYTLSANVENLYLTGSRDINASGNMQDNTLKGNSGDNLLQGGAGDDTIYSSRGTDTIIGGAGADTIITTGGTNIIYAGVSDQIYTQGGNNIIFAGGGGANWLADFSNSSYSLKWRGADADANALTTTWLTYNSALGNIKAALSGAAMYSVSNLISQTTTFDPALGNVSFKLQENSGNDLLVESGDWDYNGFGGSDAIYANWALQNTAISIDNSDSTLKNNFNGGTIQNIERLLLVTGSADDVIKAADFDDEVETGAGNDIVAAGRGSNKIDAGAGNDTLSVIAQSGQISQVDGGVGDDSLSMDFASSNYALKWRGLDEVGADVASGYRAYNSSMSSIDSMLAAEGISQLNATTVYRGAVNLQHIENLSTIGGSSNDLMLSLGMGDFDGQAGTDAIYADWSAQGNDIIIDNTNTSLVNDFNGGSITNVERLILKLGSADDTVKTGDYDDEIVAGAGNDVIEVGKGNNRVEGGAGNDTIAVVAQSGQLSQVDGGVGDDSLSMDFADSNYALKWRGLDEAGADVASGYRAYNSSMSSIDSMLAAEGISQLNATTVYRGAVNLQHIENLSTIGGSSNDLMLSLGMGDFDGQAGTDAIYADWSAQGNDIIIDNTNTSLVNDFNGGSITNVERLLVKTGSGHDVIRAGDYDDEIVAGAGNDVIEVGKGNNRVEGGAGNDTIAVVAQSGQLSQVDGGVGDDSLSMDFASSNYALKWRGLDEAGADVAGGYRAYNSSMSSIDSMLNVADLTQLNATTVYRGAVNLQHIENLSTIGGSSNDLMLSLGAGDFDGQAGTDAIYADWSAQTSAINIDNRDVAAEKSFNQGTIKNVERLILKLGSADDTVKTGDYDDEIVAGAGNDVIEVGKGNNRVEGGAGNDTIAVVAQSGQLSQVDGGVGDDSLSMDFASSNYALKWRGLDEAGADVAGGYRAYNSSMSSIDSMLNVADLTQLNATTVYRGATNLSNIENVSIVGGSSHDLLLAFGRGDWDGKGGSSDTLYADWGLRSESLVINNVDASVRSEFAIGAIQNIERLLIRLGRGDDVVQSGVKDDALHAGDGHDVLIANAGNDVLSNAGGNALLDGGIGTDSLTGDVGNELFIGGTGNDVIITGDGADLLLFNQGDGQDTIHGDSVGQSAADNTLSLGGVSTMRMCSCRRLLMIWLLNSVVVTS